MRTIWKISVPVDDQRHIFDLPPGPIVHAGRQHRSGQVEVWVEVDSDQPPEPIAFQCYGTGHPIPADADYIGTSIDGPFVWHVYEVALP